MKLRAIQKHLIGLLLFKMIRLTRNVMYAGAFIDFAHRNQCHCTIHGFRKMTFHEVPADCN